jgi:TRAP-type C4-dicarboxylate transport system substrate-binding protein
VTRLLPMLSLLALAAPARAQAPVLLKLASVAPENSAWAQALHSFGREVEASTHGQVRIKWYLGGIAGDDLQAGARIQNGQLDGVASGGMFCSQLSPTLRALRLLSTEREQSAYATSRLKPVIDDEFQRHGFVNLAETGLGPDVLFTRQPARGLDDLKRGQYWVWDLDEDLRVMLTEMGIRVVPLPLEKARHAYDDAKIDGFVALPTAALAFQWSAQANYLSDLRVGFISGCLTIANRAFDPLPLETQRTLRNASGRLRMAFEAIGKSQDQALLDGLFARQGLKRLAVKEVAQSEFAAAARSARARLGPRLVPSKWFEGVRAVLEEHAGAGASSSGAGGGGGGGDPAR